MLHTFHPHPWTWRSEAPFHFLILSPSCTADTPRSWGERKKLTRNEKTKRLILRPLVNFHLELSWNTKEYITWIRQYGSAIHEIESTNFRKVLCQSDYLSIELQISELPWINYVRVSICVLSCDANMHEKHCINQEALGVRDSQKLHYVGVGVPGKRFCLFGIIRSSQFKCRILRFLDRHWLIEK